MRTVHAAVLTLLALVASAGADPRPAATAPATRPATGCTTTVQSAKIDVVLLKPHATTPDPAPAGTDGGGDLFSGLRDGAKPIRDERPTDQKFLVVRLKVTNTGREPCLYHPLDGSDAKCPTMAICHDDARHVFALVNFGGEMDVVGAVRAARTLKPGESVTDVVVFEVPPTSARGLRLLVPKENVGRDDRVEPLPITPDR